MLSCAVLDMACHVPLYRALLELLRAIAVCSSLTPLLLPLDSDDDSSVSISSLLEKMKQCVDTYASRLKYVLVGSFMLSVLVTHAQPILAKQGLASSRVCQYTSICVSLCKHPSTPLDNIRVMVIVWRLRGNIIRTAMCWIV